jgi:aspartate aminotransferase-like enzyme
MNHDTRSRLFTPGPTHVPRPIREAMDGPLLHHRSEEFRGKVREVTEGLREIIRTRQPVVLLTSSGTGAMEAALANVAKPGDKVLITASGKFGWRWQELAAAYGLEIRVVEAGWGQPVTPAVVESALQSNGPVDVVFTTQTETSTGVLQDVAAIAGIAKSNGAVVVVDVISSLCAEEFDMDGWNVDVAVGGSQKGFGVPPGLSFVAVSEAAVERIRRPGFPRYYFDLERALSSLEKWNTAYSPAIPQVLAMAVALDMIRAEGLSQVILRHRHNAQAVRAAATALGLNLFAATPCHGTTAVLPTRGNAGDIIRTMENKYGIKIAGGQAHLSGKLIRLGHLGFYSETDIYTLIAALEGTLTELGINPAPGRGMASALESYQTNKAVTIV